MFKVLFLCDAQDVEHTKKIVNNLHKDNGDEIIVSSSMVQHDILIKMPKIQKKSAIILDHSGTVIRLGQPHEIEYNELFSDKDAFKIAQEQRKKELPEKTDKECSSCHYIKPAGQYICEKCGFKPIFGQDGEVDETINLASINKINQDKVSKRKFYHELCGVWQEKINAGKTTKKGWIAYTYKARFGSWPDGFKFRPEEPSAETMNYVKHLIVKNIKQKEKAKASKEKTGKEGIAKLREMLDKK